MTTLIELRDMLDAATGPLDYISACDATVASGFSAVETVRLTMLALQGSIDAALMLVERLLPREPWWVGTNVDGKTAHPFCARIGFDNGMFSAPTAPLAILKALVAALIAKEEAL